MKMPETSPNKNTVGKKRNCLLQAISPFPPGFSRNLYCSHIKTKACLGKGLKEDFFSLKCVKRGLHASAIGI